MSLHSDELNRWGVPLLSILGALGLATASIYRDLSRRLPRRNQSIPPAVPAATAGMARENRYLESAVVLLIAAWLMRYLSDRWGGWLNLAGYGALVAAASLLALHVARRLSAVQRGSDGE